MLPTDVVGSKYRDNFFFFWSQLTRGTRLYYVVHFSTKIPERSAHSVRHHIFNDSC